jgi:hypothetical protein
MRLYSVNRPYTSTNLKRIYNKKLEVFSGELEPSDRDYSSMVIDTVYVYSRNKWVEKPLNKKRELMVRVNLINDNMDISYSNNQLVFTTLELAKASKLLVTQQLDIKIKKELDDIRAALESSLPNVSKPLAKMYEEYPEYFV